MKAVTLAGGPKEGRAHDRMARDLPINAKVAPVTIDDPYEPGGKIIAIRSLRDDTLAYMHQRRQIDDAQYQAGRHWQRAYELAEVGGARAIDPTREAVDGGGILQIGVTDVQCTAFRSLSKATAALGLEGGAIIQDVLGSQCTIEQAAARRGLSTEREREYIGRRFRECLDTLAVVYGYAMTGTGRIRPLAGAN